MVPSTHAPKASNGPGAAALKGLNRKNWFMSWLVTPRAFQIHQLVTCCHRNGYSTFLFFLFCFWHYPGIYVSSCMSEWHGLKNPTSLVHFAPSRICQVFFGMVGCFRSTSNGAFRKIAAVQSKHISRHQVSCHGACAKPVCISTMWRCPIFVCLLPRKTSWLIR